LHEFVDHGEEHRRDANGDLVHRISGAGFELLREAHIFDAAPADWMNCNRR
jgi:hypothetical protein